MGRRKRDDEVAFGSDSFLDIVANIVGILIILIVIAGVRVSQAPAISQSAPPEMLSAEEPPVAPAPADPPEPTEPSPLIQVDEPRLMPPPPAVPVKSPLPPQPPPKLVRRVQETQATIDRLTREREELSVRISTSSEQADSLRQQLAERQVALHQVQSATESGRQVIADLQTDLDTKQRTIAGLRLELADTEAAQPPPQELRHKLTPVGRQVDGEELHFLLSKNRVAVVPIAELAEDLQQELIRNKNQLIRGLTRVGTVGPVKGFKMEYVVERRAVSLIDELRQGTAVVKVGVSEWRVIPQPTVISESSDEALRAHSRFLRALRQAGRKATLTFWVYPDSFALYRLLQDFAHDNSFSVAGRPLPEGIPIIGSNQGSRSVAQ